MSYKTLCKLKTSRNFSKLHLSSKSSQLLKIVERNENLWIASDPPCTWSPSPWFMSDFSAQTAFWILNHFSVLLSLLNLQKHYNIFHPHFRSLALFNHPLAFVLTSHQPNWKIVKQTFGSLYATKENRLNEGKKL